MKLITFLLLSITVTVFSISPSLASNPQPTWDPSRYHAIFGDANEFVQRIEDTARPQLNEYMGLAVASFGFGLVLRALIR